MNLTLRIPQSVLCVARQDLARSHPFAYERIGFFRCRPTVRSDLIVITGYDAVPDEQYIRILAQARVSDAWQSKPPCNAS